MVFQGCSSPPSCRASPVSLPRSRLLAEPGGARASKFKRFLASVLTRGVRMGLPGVRPPQAGCAGLGVTFTKSAKLNCWFGVPILANIPPPSVGVMPGSAACWLGGVEGGNPGCPLPLATRAGVGELARYMSRSAPSSLVWCWWFGARCICFGGGVRGGEEPTIDPIFWKLWSGRSGSISSDGLL